MNIYPIHHFPPVIPIGVQTENGVKDIGFNVSGWLDKWPDMQLYVWVTRPTETAAYPAAATLEGDVLVWHVSEGDTDIEGLGTVEIEGVADGVRALTGGCTTEVKKTTKSATAEPPDPIKDWHDRLMEAFTGGESNLYIVQVRPLSEDFPAPYSDKTQEEIRAAVADGKTCLLVYKDGSVYEYVGEVEYGSEGLCPTFAGAVMYRSDKRLWYRYMVQVRPDKQATQSGDPLRTPTPQKLIVTGAVEAEYDGSNQVTVNIPSGGTLYVTATITEEESDTSFKLAFDVPGAEVVAAIKAGKAVACLLDMGTGEANLLPASGYNDAGTVTYIMSGEDMMASIAQNSDATGSMRIVPQAAQAESRPTTPIYVTSDDYSVTTCSMTFAEIVACIEAGTLGMPIVWRKQWDRLVRIPLTVQSVQHNADTIEYANVEGHGLYHNHDDSIGFAYNDSLT